MEDRHDYTKFKSNPVMRKDPTTFDLVGKCARCCSWAQARVRAGHAGRPDHALAQASPALTLACDQHARNRVRA